jgi:predicted AAA+ superfamily ATPase
VGLVAASRSYIRRVVDDELDEYLAAAPAVAVAVSLEGARAIGKTSTAGGRAATRYELDDEAHLAVVSADVDLALSRPAPVLIDEWQHHPPVWDRVRRAVDKHEPPGPFLLTGSVAPKGTGVHTGAGRIIALRMRPLSLAERWPGVATVSLRELLSGGQPAVRGFSSAGLADYTDEMLKSGFPGLRDLPARLRNAQLEGYIQRIIDKDFRELGHQPRNPAALRRWMQAYAAATATTSSWEKLRDAATSGQADKPARTTVMPYRDVLERLYVLDPVPGWKPTRNHIARLTQPPKHHLADPALATTLLGVTAERLLAGGQPAVTVPRDGTFLGALFESLVTQSVRVYAQNAQASVGHLRAFAGEHEVDLIIERDDGRIVAIEVKLRPTARDEDVMHLTWLRRHMADDLLDAVVITIGSEAYRRPDGIAVVPAALLGP